MGSGVTLARQLESTDPGVGLQAVAQLRVLIDAMERLHVDRARDSGWTWPEIAASLGVTKQAVHEKHAKRRHLEDKE